MKFAAVVALLVVLASACYSTPPNRLCIEPGFTPEERADIELAVEKWRDFTADRAELTLSCEFQAPNIHRIAPTDPLVVRTDAEIGGPALGIELYGQVYLVTDRIYAWHFGVRQIAQHEIGHFIGLRWPGCEAPRDCVHVPNGPGITAIMTKAQSGAAEFTPADHAFCVASGLCEQSSR